MGTPMQRTLVLEKNAGISPIRFGMTIQEASSAMEAWGAVSLTPATEHDFPRLNAQQTDYSVDIYANFEDGLRLTSIEIWRPEGPGRTTVLFEGIDIFSHDASSVLRELAQRGYEIDDSDPFFPKIDQIALGFNRDFGDERDDDDYALYFANLLLAPAGYYSGVE
jgi:hypothetical protein